MKSRRAPLRMGLASTNPNRNGSEPRRVEEAGGSRMPDIFETLHLHILTRRMDRS